MRASLAFLLFLPAACFAGDPPPPGPRVEVEVTRVRESMRLCDCSLPQNLGRICISATRERAQGNAPSLDLSSFALTAFDARMEGENVVLRSKAYYQRCTHGSPSHHFVDPELEAISKENKSFGMEGVRGLSAGMQVAFGNGHQFGPYTPRLRGAFGEETFRWDEGTRYEAWRREYPGVVELRKPLFGFLTDFQIRRVLDGEDLFRVAKVWLSIEKAEGKLVAFGDYDVTLRFFRKPNQKPKDLWDVSVVGLEVLP